jgi:hypothetical protein
MGIGAWHFGDAMLGQLRQNHKTKRIRKKNKKKK